MKYSHYLLLLPICILATACGRSRCCNDVVCETYVHPYGLEMSSNEWCRQGSSGEVITSRKDGVVIKRSFQQGVVDGQVSYTFPHRDTIETIEVYSKGDLIKVTHNFPSGAVKSETEYASPTNSVVKSYYDQGTLRSSERFKDDRLAQATYFNLKETLESSVEDFSGKSTRRDIYGQLLSVDTIEDGRVVASTTYHINGMPEAITPFSSGVVDGTRKTFLPGGEPYTIEQWQNGQQHGITQEFQDGEKVAEVPYYRGRKEGVEKCFRNEKDVVEEISWHMDARHGPTNRYVEGKVITDWYYNDAPVSKAVFDKRSALLQPQ